MPVTLFMDSRVLKALDRDLQTLAMDFAGVNRMRTPLLKIAKEVLGPSIGRNFAVGGRPEKWEQVGTSNYRNKKGDREGNRPPLWVTGKLKRSASAFARFRVRSNELTYGNFPSTLWYGIVHDDGALADKANIPQRPFALIQSEDIKDSIEILGDWVETRVNAHVKRLYI